MAIYQVGVRKNIATLNEGLNSAIIRLRLDREEHFKEMSIITGILKENASLFQELQDYYNKNTDSFDYLGGILQGYISVAQDMQASTQLTPLMPLVQEIIGQLETMSVLEVKITQLIEEWSI